MEEETSTVRSVVLPCSKFRIFGPGEVVDPDVVLAEGEYLVEWAGRVGHPSSYGCLGGRGSDRAGVDVNSARSGQPFRTSLAGLGDPVCWGLPAEYRTALGGVALGLIVTHAAHGQASSSPGVFTSLARVLALVLRTRNRASDHQIEAAWERSPFS
jgi:hypothetical protein